MLLEKPVWQMTGAEFSCMLRHTFSDRSSGNRGQDRKVAHGLAELKESLGCGRTRLIELQKLGVFDDAIISSVGKKYLYDVDKALEAAMNYIKSLNK